MKRRYIYIYASQIFTVFLTYFSRTKSTECEGVSCSQEAKVSIPRRVGSRPRKGCARTSKGVGDGKSFMENFLPSIILFRSTVPFLRHISHVYIYLYTYIWPFPVKPADIINPFEGKKFSRFAI